MLRSTFVRRTGTTGGPTATSSFSPAPAPAPPVRIKRTKRSPTKIFALLIATTTFTALIFFSSKINSYKRVQFSPLSDHLESHESNTSSSFNAATAANANATADVDVVASVQVEKKEPSSSSTIAYPSSSTSACHTSLNEMSISMAKYSSPPGSKSFLKHQRIFAHATKFHILRHGNKNNIFSDTTQNIIQMFESYGLVESLNETIDSDMEGNRTIMVEFSMNHHEKVPAKCTGSTCHTIPRISIQAEQITIHAYAPEFVQGCHASPNCLIWDFSDINFDWAKSLPSNASESFLIVPHMFHDRLREWYPKDKDDIKAYTERSEDAVFFGAYTSRRKVFENKYINNNGTLSRYKVTFRKKMRPFGVLTGGYSNAKICLVVHSFLADSGGEYHRISDFKRFGCVPVMETFGDKLTVETLRTCAGIKFADFDDLPNAVVSELKRMNDTSNDILREEQLAIDRWWDNGIDWSTFLEKVLGPRSSVNM